MGELRVLMPDKGDVKVEWNPNTPAEVEMAKEQFDSAIEKGWTAFQVTRLGDKGEQVAEFDPDAARIFLVKPIAGG